MLARNSYLWRLAIAGLFLLSGGTLCAQTLGDLSEDLVLLEKMSRPMALDLAAADPDELMTCLVILEPPAETAFKSELPVPLRIELYRRLAFDMQMRMLDDVVDEDGEDIDVLEQHWLLNALVVKGKPRQIRKIAKQKKVRKLARGGRIRLIDPAGSVPAAAELGTAWNVAMVGADDGWSRGYDGTGIVVGHLDTGVDASHPALAGKWAGYWFDAVDGRPEPYDDHGHGTHTLGVMMGGDGQGALSRDIGVAPGARWVGAKVLDSEGNGTYRQCLRGLEYIVELKTRGVDVRIICASWTLDDMGRDVLIDVCDTLLELNVLPVFAVGNDGPGAGSADVPGSYASVLAVGAVDAKGLTPAFSSRGPAPSLNADAGEPLVPNWRFHKPDLAAPGVDVCSAVPGGGYALMSGSSMAAPHVAGAAALLLEKNPTLTPRELAASLLGAARPSPLSTSLPDNSLGWGILDVQGALATVQDLSATAVEEAAPVAPAISVRTGRGAGAIISYALGRDAVGAVEVFDLAGRLVRRYEVRGDGAPRDTYWDGADADGRRVTSGVYVARLSGAGVKASRTFSLIR